MSAPQPTPAAEAPPELNTLAELFGPGEYIGPNADAAQSVPAPSDDADLRDGDEDGDDTETVMRDDAAGEAETDDTPSADPPSPARKREFTNPDQALRYIRNAIARGDEDAIARVLRDKEASKTYQAIIEAADARAAERAAAIAEADQAFATLEQLRQFDRDTFSEQLADPEVAEFYAQMRRFKAGGGGRPAVRTQNPLAATFQTLRTDPDAARLTDADWAALDPDNFTEQQPAVAQTRMVRQFERLVAKRGAPSAGARTDPNAVNPQAVRQAIRNSPPVVNGAPPGAPLSYRDQEAQYVERRMKGLTTPEEDRAFATLHYHHRRTGSFV